MKVNYYQYYERKLKVYKKLSDEKSKQRYLVKSLFEECHPIFDLQLKLVNNVNQTPIKDCREFQSSFEKVSGHKNSILNEVIEKNLHICINNMIEIYFEICNINEMKKKEKENNKQGMYKKLLKDYNFSYRLTNSAIRHYRLELDDKNIEKDLVELMKFDKNVDYRMIYNYFVNEFEGRLGSLNIIEFPER